MTKTKIPKLSSLIKEKKFDYVNSDITDTLFSVPKEIGTDFKLYHFDRYISSEDAIKEMEKDGYKPANIYELLTWTGWNDNDWVVALGSVGKVDGDRRVPYLDGSGSRRDLHLRWFGLGWDALCRFLGVRNLSSESVVLGDSVPVTLGHSALCPHCNKVINLTPSLEGKETMK